MNLNQLPLSPVAAADWVSETMIGTVGTAVGTLVIAAIGLAMLRGHLPFRRGAATITGCFILFSSRVIAGGLINMRDGDFQNAPPPVVAVAPAYVAPVPPPVPYDPYAGASVPVRPQENAPIVIPR